jgi:hypothetical protein
MGAKLTRLTHKTAIQLHLVADRCTICSSRSRLPVRKLLDIPSYFKIAPPELQLQIKWNDNASRHTKLSQRNSLTWCQSASPGLAIANMPMAYHILAAIQHHFTDGSKASRHDANYSRNPHVGHYMYSSLTVSCHNHPATVIGII